MAQERGSLRNQYLACILANISTIVYGSSCGWTSPSIPILESTESPLPTGPISKSDTSWIGSILCVGGIVGTIVYGWMSDKYGRKIPTCLIAVPQVCSWLLIIYAQNVNYLILSRFLSGLAGGGVFVVIPLFISEIAEDRIRGTLGSFLVFSSCFGYLLTYIAGNYLSYSMLPWTFLPLPFIFLCGFIYLPETPLYLIKINKIKEAEASLKFYRGGSATKDELILSESKDAKIDKDAPEEDAKMHFSDFTTRAVVKALIIGISLHGFYHFSGIFAMLNYTATIFEEAGSNLSPNMSSVVIGVIQIIGCYVSTLLIDKAGRKMLFIISSVGLFLGLGAMGSFVYLRNHAYDVSSMNWIPLVCLSWVILIGNVGVLNVPFVVMTEIFPLKLKAFACSLCLLMAWSFGFVALKCLPILIDSLGMDVTFFIFAVGSITGTIFVIVLVPETKGKSFDDILKILQK